MRIIVKIFIIFLLSFMMNGCAGSLKTSVENVTGVKIVEYGISETKTIKSPNYSNSVAGSVNVVKNEIITNQTDTIPLRIGLSFGLKYIIITTDGRHDEYPVTYRVTYPKTMVNPATGARENEWQFKTYSKANDPRYTGFRFESDYELLEGEWIFEIIVDKYRDKQIFHMVKWIQITRGCILYCIL